MSLVQDFAIVGTGVVAIIGHYLARLDIGFLGGLALVRFVAVGQLGLLTPMPIPNARTAVGAALDSQSMPFTMSRWHHYPFVTLAAALIHRSTRSPRVATLILLVSGGGLRRHGVGRGQSLLLLFLVALHNVGIILLLSQVVVTGGTVATSVRCPPRASLGYKLGTPRLAVERVLLNLALGAAVPVHRLVLTLGGVPTRRLHGLAGGHVMHENARGALGAPRASQKVVAGLARETRDRKKRRNDVLLLLGDRLCWRLGRRTSHGVRHRRLGGNGESSGHDVQSERRER